MIQSFDENALLFIQEHLRSTPVTELMRWMTRLGDGGIMWIVLGVLLLCFASTRRRGAVYLSALAGTAVLNNLLIKPLAARPRPYAVVEGLRVLVEKLSSYSFPSGHTSASFAAFNSSGFREFMEFPLRFNATMKASRTESCIRILSA